MSNGLRALLAAACVAVLASAACTSASAPSHSAARDPVGGVPGDLWLEATIRLGRGVSTSARVDERPARLVLLPDGTLCASTDRVEPAGERPPRVRRLAREQLTDLWSALVSAGFTDPALADTRGNLALLEPAAGEILATLEIHANGQRFAFVRRYRAGDEAEAAMRRIVRAVASVAWASDEAFAESAEVPQRSDMGADPYARFAPRRDGVKP